MEKRQEKVHGFADLLENLFLQGMFDHFDVFFLIFSIISYEIYFQANDAETHF